MREPSARREMPPTCLERPHAREPERFVALLVPFAYFFRSRVPRARRKLGWLLNYLLPVLALAAAARGDWAGVLPAALMLVAVYAAYEFGYLVNDTVVVEREAMPTWRLDEATRRWLRSRLGLAFGVRAAIGLACLALLARSADAPGWEIAAAGWLLIWPCFALYNHWRGRITIALHFVLVGLRFLLPIVAASRPESVAPGWAALLLLYALPNSYEAAWKPRYGLAWLKRAFVDEHRFRVAWFVALTLIALAALARWPTVPQQVFAAACAYYLAQRLLAWYFTRRLGSSVD